MKSLYHIAAALSALVITSTAMAAQDPWLIHFTRQNQLAYDARQAKLAAAAHAQPQAPQQHAALVNKPGSPAAATPAARN